MSVDGSDGKPYTAKNLAEWMTTGLTEVSPQALSVAIALHDSKAWGITPYRKRRELIRCAALACDAGKPDKCKECGATIGTCPSCGCSA
jgi:hypothetical protein